MNYRLLLGSALLPVLLVPAGPAAAADAREGDAPTISVNFKDVALPDALREISARTGLLYRVEPGVPKVRVNLNVRDVPPEALLRLMLRLASTDLKDQSITYSKEKLLYVIKMGPKEEVVERERPAPVPLDDGFQDAQLNGKLTLSVKDEPLEQFINRIFAGTGVQYTLLPEVRKQPVTLMLHQVGKLAAARLAIRQVAAKVPRAGLWRDGDVYVFGVVKPPKELPHQP
jgi:type II secretory pathway component GspD/PulD (secretin)